MNLYDVIKKPLITEKSSQMKELFRQYAFAVDKKADKFQIKKAVESLFKVHVLDVNTMNFRGKFHRVGKNVGQRSNWKKAIVTLKEGEKLDFVEGV